MKQAILTTLAICFLAAGLQAQETKTKDETAQGKPMKMKQEKDKMKMKGDMSMQSVDLPYQATYSSQFRMGNPAQTKMILDMYRDYENNDFSKGDPFADTVTVITPDGQVIKGRDAVMSTFKQQRAGLSDIKFTISAAFPVRSIDRNADWVCVWGSDTGTMTSNNATVSEEFQSIWNINKDGKVAFIQFFQGKMPAQQ